MNRLQHFFKRAHPWMDPAVSERVEAAIRAAERLTSGEIRVFTERRCSYIDAVDRARELFQLLNMHQTKQRNAVLVYWAVRDQQVALYADEGIHQRMGDSYWNACVQQMLVHFRSNDPALALESCVLEVGAALARYFPHDAASDRNELSDTMLIGR